jgi:hypothetical protein
VYRAVMARPRSHDCTTGNPEARRIAYETFGLFDVVSPLAVERYEAEYGSDWRRVRNASVYSGCGVASGGAFIVLPVPLNGVPTGAICP